MLQPCHPNQLNYNAQSNQVKKGAVVQEVGNPALGWRPTAIACWGALFVCPQ